jgi:hypothetical protein
MYLYESQSIFESIKDNNNNLQATKSIQVVCYAKNSDEKLGNIGWRYEDNSIAEENVVLRFVEK